MKTQLGLIALAAGALLAATPEAGALPPTAHLETGVVTAIDCATHSISIQPKPGAEAKTFQPMNVNFGLFPPIDAKGGRKGRKDRYKAYTDRAKEAFAAWLAL